MPNAQWSRRPRWPWMLICFGLILVLGSLSDLFSSYQTVQQVDSSSAVKAVGVIDSIGGLVGQEHAGALIDPRNRQPYVTAKQNLFLDLGMVGVGGLMVLLSLIRLASWRPVAVGASAGAPVRVGRKREMGFGTAVMWTIILVGGSAFIASLLLFH